MNATELLTAIRSMEPERHDWRDMCQLVAWYLPRVTGTPKNEIVTYPTAKAAYLASRIVSHDPDAAPAGAFHYWRNPERDGHVAIALGAGDCLMASNILGGDGLGVIGVADYTQRTGNPYQGWSNTNGANPDIRYRFQTQQSPKSEPKPEPEAPEMVIIRNSKTGEIALVNPTTGQKWRMPNPDYVRLWETRKWAKRLPDVPDNEFKHYLQMTAALGAADASVETRIDKALKALKI